MRRVKIVGAVWTVIGLCLSTHATILAPGTVGLDPPQAPGPAPLDTLITPYSFGGLNGTVTSWVVSDPANSLGGLSFYYQVNNTGTEGVSRISAGDFGIIPGAPVEVSTITAPFDSSVTGGDAPTIASRSSGAGSVVGFNFVGVPVGMGQSSVVLVVNTPFLTFGMTPGSVINSSSFNLNLLGPSIAPIPEASTAIAGSLLLLPLAAGALRIVRKR